MNLTTSSQFSHVLDPVNFAMKHSINHLREEKADTLVMKFVAVAKKKVALSCLEDNDNKSSICQ